MKKYLLIFAILIATVACSEDENDTVAWQAGSYDFYSAASIGDVCASNGGVFDANTNTCVKDNSTLTSEETCVMTGGIFVDNVCEYKLVNIPCSQDHKNCMFIDNGTFTPCVNCLNNLPCTNIKNCSLHATHYDNATHGGMSMHHNGMNNTNGGHNGGHNNGWGNGGHNHR